MLVALFHGRGMVSALIRWQTRSAYSHAAVILDDGSVVEAWQGDGVRRLAGLKHGTEGIEFYRLSLDLTHVGQSEVSARVTEFLNEQLGKPYDYLGVARFVSRRPMPARSRGRWFCSELVFAAFRVAGVNLLARTEAWEVSPGLLSRSPLLEPVSRGDAEARRF